MFIQAISLAFILSLILSLGVLRFFPNWNLLDKPELYGHKRKPIPYPGGVAPLFAILITLLVFLPLEGTLFSLVLGALLLAFICFLDDRFSLSPVLRLGVQFFVALLLVIGGIGMSSISGPFGTIIALDQWSWIINVGEFSFTFTLFADLLTVIWVMVMINAFNWIDGVPGMTASVSSVAAFVLLLLSLRPEFHYLDQSLAITLSSVILGASLAFLIFDFPPPKILMGDTGSMLLGFFLAVTAIISGGKIATTVLVLGFPILDFAWVILRRILKGQSPFKGDLWHFHHRLLNAGFTSRQVVLFFSVTSALFGALALFLQTEGKVFVFIVILFLMSALSGLLYFKRE